MVSRPVLLDRDAFHSVVYLPAGHGAVPRAWPVILSLHDVGGIGTDGWQHVRTGLGATLLLHPERYPAVVVMPQCPPGFRWSGGVAMMALAALDQALAEFGGDPARQYLTGTGSGGAGCFLLAALDPWRFAAALPVGGCGDPELMAPRLVDIPLWAFHGRQDHVVPATRSREMVEAIRAAGGRLARFLELPRAGHDSGDLVYRDPEVPPWLFGQVRLTP